MTRLKTILATGAVAALVGAGTVVASTAPASAYTVCNRWGNCWQVHRHYYYPAYYGAYGDPYYDPYYYNSYPYPYYGPSYGYYGGPSIGFGFSFGGGHGFHGGHHH